MSRYFNVVYFILSMLLYSSCSTQHVQTRDEEWPEITHEARPWTRWWWHGNAVTKEGITAELEAFRNAGIGGVEITPIYGVYGYEDKFIDFLSPQWVELLLHTLAEADRLGLGVDMATGTGWPFGGPWVTDEDACKNVKVATYVVTSPASLPRVIEYTQQPYLKSVGFNVPHIAMEKVALAELKQPIQANKNLQKLAIDQVQFERKLPLIALVAFDDKGNATDITQHVDNNGRLQWKYPGGRWTLYALFQGWHGKMVERAGPGGEGNVIDHFSVQALSNYLSRFDSAFAGKDLTSLRAFFNDSYEVDDAYGTANWTPAFLEEFEKRRGYDLRNHLSSLFADKYTEKSKRILCDYRETIAELLLENFTQPWKSWAHKKSAVVRNQAHGSPANILDLYSVADIPEIEGTDPLRIRMASSAANVTGKRLVSAEAATWLNEHFESNLADIKEALDRFMLNGVNHILYHGTAYSPLDEPWPGWLFYAAVHVNPRNPLWTDIATLNQYVARCQAFLQNTVADNDILLYYPIYDRFSTPGREIIEHFDGIGKQFEGTSFARCAETLLTTGYSFDFISDKQIHGLHYTTEGIQTEGLNTYRTIVIPSCQYMPVSTLEKIYSLAEEGATIIFYEGLPKTFAGFAKAETKEKCFVALMYKLSPSESAGNFSIKETGKGKILLGANLEPLLQETKARKENLVELGINYQRMKDKRSNVLYLINNEKNQSFDGWIELNTVANAAVLFNPMTGATGKAIVKKASDNRISVYLQLRAHETLIIKASDGNAEMKRYPFYMAGGEPVRLTKPWKVEFVSGGPVLPEAVHMDSLVSWTRFGTPYSAFSGSAAYTTAFNKPDVSTTLWKLNLGEVKESASVYLNDHYLGTLIGPEYAITFDNRLLKQDNTLRVIVSNGMANRISDMDRKKIPWKKFYNINFPSRKESNRTNGIFDASSWQPVPSGVLGPVTITPVQAL